MIAQHRRHREILPVFFISLYYKKNLLAYIEKYLYSSIEHLKKVKEHSQKKLKTQKQKNHDSKRDTQLKVSTDNH